MTAMLEGFKQSWNRFRSLEPGSRFEEFALLRRRQVQSGARRALSFVGGVALMGVGAIALVAPGPGVLMLALGTALVARESITVARAMDWLEPRLRRVADAGLRIWREAPVPLRVMLVIVATAVTAAAGWAAWTLTFG
jgi:hypothetical protein